MPALPQMISIPAGVVELRDARAGSRPTHTAPTRTAPTQTTLTRTVSLRAFEIGRTPVTCAEYDGVAARPSSPADRAALPAHPVSWFAAVQWCNLASDAAGLDRAYAIDDRRVSWDVGADGFRLPTEAEWEWACRAEVTAPRYGPLGEIAWTAADEVAGAQPVAGKAANAFGLFDTLGNVWEWCWDHADTARYGDYRSLRGGGWADREWSVRASVRRGSAPDAVLEDVGFRVARGAVGEPGVEPNAAQGWSAAADRERADVRGPRPIGWTPLRDA
ncbi:formylglycine-generating enzyme family protein [Kitasatospora indigofera]|uniref:formylglycine-generating enzyme family protein n=1 Tax=Kitasatospora indigofera TaxID=67307 RepID=UPI0036A848F3